jgi:hypothetical protein
MDKSNKWQLRIISQRMLLIATIAALPLLANAAPSEPQKAAQKVGEEYEISKSYETSEQASDGSSGSSRGRDTIVERVIGVREGGLELEFDLPKRTAAEERVRSWQFPVRVFRTTDGAMQLLNRPELEVRVEGWLKAGGWTRAACGQWIFTWNAFRIECEPESVITTLKSFDLRSAGVEEGASYQVAEAGDPGILTRKSTGPNGATFTVLLQVNPDVVRRAAAESDVAVGQMMQKPVTLVEALRERAKEDVTGTISVTIDTDAAGNIWRRTKVTKLETKGPDTRTKSQTATETVERRPVATAGNASLLLE